MRCLAIAVLLAAACSGGGGDGGGSTPAPPTPPVTTGAVSGPSPFAAGCGLGGGGTVYINAEVEPSIAVDPRDPNHWIGAWQQDRWSNGSSRGIVAATTFDGGATWTTRVLAFSSCAGGEFARATDPWVTIGPNGAAYVSAIGATGGVFGVGSANAVLVSQSSDGGLSWSTPVTLIRDGAAAFNDKETITADPTDARFAYAVWDRITANTGPTLLARTTDGGVTWSGARTIYDPGPGHQTIGNLVRVLPDGTVVNLAAHLIGTDEGFTQATLEVIRSIDHGATWSAPIVVADFRPLGARDPVTGQAIRDGSIIPQMAVAPSGALYVVWQDGRFSGDHDGIAIARSADGGLTWSAPVRVNAAPAAAAFTPQVHVRADGTIGVTYFDLRSNSADPATLLADHWLARSTDGVTWTDTHLDGPFDIATAPLVEGGVFLGDYMGLASAGSAFVSFYIRTTGDAANRTDVFAKRIAATAEAGAAPASTLSDRDVQFDRRSFEHIRRAIAARAVR